MSVEPTKSSAVAIVPSNRRSMAVLVSYALILIGFLATGVDSIFDGYWRRGTLGYLVLPAVVLTVVAIVQALPIYRAHILRRDPIIGISDNRLFYMSRGRKQVDLASVAEVTTQTFGLMRFVVFSGSNGKELGRYPLILIQDRDRAVSRLRSLAGRRMQSS